jgi:hypothetical protein
VLLGGENVGGKNEGWLKGEGKGDLGRGEFERRGKEEGEVFERLS